MNNPPKTFHRKDDLAKAVSGKPVKKHKSHKLRNSFVLISVFLLFFGLSFYGIAKFFDTYKFVFQKPVYVDVKVPVYMTKRLVYKEPPKAQYINVNPFTTPKEIDEKIKNHESFDYKQSASLETISKETVRALVKNKVVQKWGAAAWPEIDYILTNESGYDPYIVNKSSGACGIFQALPCSKLPSLDITDQINWGIEYIETRYNYENGKTQAENAADFKREKGWY